MIEKFAAWAGIAPEDVQTRLYDWTPHPGRIDGELVCIAIMSGAEIHFAVAPEWRRRLILRGRTREFLAPLMERHGYLTTRADPKDGHRAFLERLGFSFTWNDGRLDHYFLHELPFSGKEN